jgi:CPA2 family monovalent cation:H+ antiporter-2
MEYGLEIVADIAIIMAIAGGIIFLFAKLKQPVILGYLLAGIIIGPYTPPFVLISRIDFLEVAAELGVILLLFGVGLEFPLSKLKKIGFKVPIGISLIEIAVMFLISFVLAWMLDWSFLDALFLGAALASSSTAIIVKVLGDEGKLKEKSALLMMAVLMAEDLFVVLLLALLPSIAAGASPSVAEMSLTVGKILLFIVGTLVIGSLVVPRAFAVVDRLNKAELLIVTSLGLCFGLSVLAHELGLSMAIGAFLAGVLLAEAVCCEKVARLTSPIKDMFAAMFFVSMGALIDVGQFSAFVLPALAVTVFMIAGKVIGCASGARIFGSGWSDSLKVGLGMAQIGEFAFIVVKAGQDIGVINTVLFPTIGVSVALTAFLTPYLVRLSYRIPPGFVPRLPRNILRRQ